MEGLAELEYLVVLVGLAAVAINQLRLARAMERVIVVQPDPEEMARAEIDRIQRIVRQGYER